MAGEEANTAAAQSKPPTLDQVSAGGVVFRRTPTVTEIALIGVGEPLRWQLPKGLVNDGETPEVAAAREVHEEAGVVAKLIAPIKTVEYWYMGHRGKGRVRFHKFVHFFLFAYESGDVADHDHEVREARWVEIGAAQKMLAFKGERSAVAKAIGLVE